MSFKYIKSTYKVPACINRLVVVDGKPGIIFKDCGNYIGVNLDHDKPGIVSNFHPVWEVEYKGIGKPRKLTRSQQRYRDYINSLYYEAGDSFAIFLGIEGK